MEKNKKFPLVSNIYSSFLESESALKRFLSRFLYKPEDIDDMAQETFLRAYSATQGRDIDSPKAYLFQVAKTMALKELSKKSKQLTDYLEEAVDNDVDSSVALEEEISAQQKVQLFCDAIAELPPQCRRVFLMRKVQALPHKAIAKELGISCSAVEKQIALGTERCKKYVEHKERAKPLKDSLLKDKGLAGEKPDENKIPRGRSYE